MRQSVGSVTARLCTARASVLTSSHVTTDLRKRLRKLKRLALGELSLNTLESPVKNTAQEKRSCLLAEAQSDVFGSNRKRKRCLSPLAFCRCENCSCGCTCPACGVVSPDTIKRRRPEVQPLLLLSSPTLKTPPRFSPVPQHLYHYLDPNTLLSPCQRSKSPRLLDAPASVTRPTSVDWSPPVSPGSVGSDHDQYMIMHPVLQERDYVNVVSAGGGAVGRFTDLLSLKRFGRVEKHMLQLGDVCESKPTRSKHVPASTVNRTTNSAISTRVERCHEAQSIGSDPTAIGSTTTTLSRRDCQRKSGVGRCTSDNPRPHPPPPPPTSLPANNSNRTGSSEFGYNIDNISDFLSKATLQTPANIPMVVTTAADLYVSYPPNTATTPTVPLNLGLVVNALFRARQWLFVQTPHSQEGYVVCSACTPLGVLPSRGGQSTTRRSASCGRDLNKQRQPQQQQKKEQNQQIVSPRPAQENIGTTAAVSRLRTVHTASSTGSSTGSKSDNGPVGGQVKTNRTDAEKMYANLTADGRAIGLAALHVRCAPSAVCVGSDDDERRQRHLQEELQTQSADERGSRTRKHIRSRHRSVHETTRIGPRVHASDDETTVQSQRTGCFPVGAAVMGVTPAMGLSVPHLADSDRNRPSAFQPLRPTAKSLESVRGHTEPVALTATSTVRQIRAPRANNKAVVVQRFEDTGQPHTLSVKRGDIVILLNTTMGEWYWVQDASGRHGYIPRCCVRGDAK